MAKLDVAAVAGPSGHHVGQGLQANLLISVTRAAGGDPVTGLGTGNFDVYWHSALTSSTSSAIRPAATEFIEARDGSVRVAPSLAKHLVESVLPLLERAAAEPAEEIARILAASTRGVKVRTRLTEADRPQRPARC